MSPIIPTEGWWVMSIYFQWERLLLWKVWLVNESLQLIYAHSATTTNDAAANATNKSCQHHMSHTAHCTPTTTCHTPPDPRYLPPAARRMPPAASRPPPAAHCTPHPAHCTLHNHQPLPTNLQPPTFNPQVLHDSQLSFLAAIGSIYHRLITSIVQHSFPISTSSSLCLTISCMY